MSKKSSIINRNQLQQTDQQQPLANQAAQMEQTGPSSDQIHQQWAASLETVKFKLALHQMQLINMGSQYSQMKEDIKKLLKIVENMEKLLLLLPAQTPQQLVVTTEEVRPSVAVNDDARVDDTRNAPNAQEGNANNDYGSTALSPSNENALSPATTVETASNKDVLTAFLPSAATRELKWLYSDNVSLLKYRSSICLPMKQTRAKTREHLALTQAENVLVTENCHKETAKKARVEEKESSAFARQTTATKMVQTLRSTVKSTVLPIQFASAASTTTDCNNQSFKSNSLFLQNISTEQAGTSGNETLESVIQMKQSQLPLRKRILERARHQNFTSTPSELSGAPPLTSSSSSPTPQTKRFCSTGEVSFLPEICPPSAPPAASSFISSKLHHPRYAEPLSEQFYSDYEIVKKSLHQFMLLVGSPRDKVTWKSLDTSLSTLHSLMIATALYSHDGSIVQPLTNSEKTKMQDQVKQLFNQVNWHLKHKPASIKDKKEQIRKAYIRFLGAFNSLLAQFSLELTAKPEWTIQNADAKTFVKSAKPATATENPCEKIAFVKAAVQDFFTAYNEMYKDI